MRPFSFRLTRARHYYRVLGDHERASTLGSMHGLTLEVINGSASRENYAGSDHGSPADHSPLVNPAVAANHHIVFDTTFCGDWAGSVWAASSCAAYAPSCQAFVAANPGVFASAYWLINSVKVYQL